MNDVDEAQAELEYRRAAGMSDCEIAKLALLDVILYKRRTKSEDARAEAKAALLDALLPVALAAVALEHDYPGLWLGPVRDAVRALSPATRETLARLAKEREAGRGA